MASFDEIAEEFGERVAGIVRECSDSEEHPKPPWKERKTAFLEGLAHHSQSAILASNADKLHNLRTIVSDYRQVGEELWDRFNPESDRAWYYSALAEVFTDLGSPLADELLASLEELKRLRLLPE